MYTLYLLIYKLSNLNHEKINFIDVAYDGNRRRL